VLVDRLWPRGIPKADAQLDQWAKNLAPSDGLRKWFSHDPQKCDRFRKRYVEELATAQGNLSRVATPGAPAGRSLWVLDVTDVARRGSVPQPEKRGGTEPTTRRM